MKIAIRDDDTSVFTRPEELVTAYAGIGEFPVSLAVVPYSVVNHGKTSPYGGAQTTTANGTALDLNGELVKFLRDGVKAGRYEILLHGISHEYRDIDSVTVPEMLWKDQAQLLHGIQIGKAYLEHLLDCSIRLFVAPSNAISPKGIYAVESAGLDLSGIIQHCDRRLNWKYLTNYVKRWSFRLVTGYPYPGVLDYGRHKEINACRLESCAYLWKLYQLCKKTSLPMVINTHYWYLNRCETKRAELWLFIREVLADGAEPAFISECME